MQIIEKLQRSRPEIVHVFDEIVKTLPDGTYLTAVKQTDKKSSSTASRSPPPASRPSCATSTSSQWLTQSGARGGGDRCQGQPAGSSFTLDRRGGSNAAGDDDARRPRRAQAPGCAKQPACAGSAPMNLIEELRSLDPRDPGRWPLPIRVGAVAVWLFVLTVIAAAFISSSGERAARSCSSTRTRSRSCARSSHQACQGREPRASTSSSSRTSSAPSAPCCASCPGKTEVPNLLVDISQTGLAAGLQEKLFQPGAGSEEGLLRRAAHQDPLTGSYHEFGEFVSGIAALPRIVTLHDIEIKPRQQGRPTTSCTLDLTAKTYRYLDEDEIAAAEADKKKDAARPKPATPATWKHHERRDLRDPRCDLLCIALACAGYAVSRPAPARDDDLQRFIEDTKKEPGGRVEPLPEVKPYETFNYADRTCARRSCRRAPVRGAGINGVRPDSKRNREFLEQFSLDTLKMVGTLNWAAASTAWCRPRTAWCIG